MNLQFINLESTKIMDKITLILWKIFWVQNSKPNWFINAFKLVKLTLQFTKIKISEGKILSRSWENSWLNIDVEIWFFFHLKLAFNRWVEVILDVIVCSSRQIFCDFCPFVSIFPMCAYDDFIFFLSPFPSFNFRIKMIMPALSALFSNSAWKKTWNHAPVFRSILLD